MRAVLSLLRVALLDLRGDLRRFGVLIACLALGVGTIAMVGAVGASLQAALDRDARLLLGGDIEARLTHRAASAGERALFERLGTVSEAIDYLARARVEGESAFVWTRGVDANYPLLGAVDFDGEGSLGDALAERDGVLGTLVDARLLDRLGVAVGDRIGIGSGEFEIRGILKSVPDEVSQGVVIGFPLLLSTSGVAATEVLKPGGLARYHYKIALNQGVGFDAAAARIRSAFPDAGWHISSPGDATEELARYFDLFRRFLTIVGLSALLVGGVGVANAVSAYVTERQRSIATMKALGATRTRVLLHFLTQVMVLTGVGIALGAGVGAALTLVALPYLGPALGLPLTPTIDWPSLGSAAVFGLLIGFTFAYLPLHRAQAMRPALLFRSVGGAAEARAGWRDWLRPGVMLPVLASLAGIFAMAVLDTDRPEIVFWYGLGAIVAFLVLRLAADLLQNALRLVPPAPDAVLRNAVKAIYRPGAPAPTVILSLGLGMALLLLIALIDNNLRHQLDPSIRVDSPTFVYMDLFEDEVAEFETLSQTDPRFESFAAVPVVRASSYTVNGEPPPELDEPSKDMAIYFGDEQPLSYSASVPQGSRVVGGAWWPAGYQGAPLVSVSEQLRVAQGLKLGDEVTFQVFGEPVTTRIASFRSYEWQRGGINFPFVLSPGALEAYPVSYFGLIKAVDGAERDLQRQLVETYPELVFIPVDEAIGALRGVIDAISKAIAVVGGLAVASGMLVLAGALATGRRQREADSVVAKVLGATRGDVIRSYVIEYGLVGALSALLAAVLGVAGTWAFMAIVLESDFVVDPLLLALVIIIASMLTIAVGAATTWSALSARPARFLREE